MCTETTKSSQTRLWAGVVSLHVGGGAQSSRWSHSGEGVELRPAY